jgi:hypothetical protein
VWKSELRNCPNLEYAMYRRGAPSKEYEEWVDRIAEEPWFIALIELVKHQGQWWVGTWQELIRQLRRRAGEEASACEDFPSTLDRLKDYAWVASDAFTRADIDFLDYELAEAYGTDEFDAPGWGPQAPVLIFRDNSVLRPDYIWTLGKVLERWDPFLLAVFLFVSNEGLGNGRCWEGTTPQFVEALSRQRPDQESVPNYISKCFRPAGSASPLPEYEDTEEEARLLRRRALMDYEAFVDRIRKNVPFLESIGIRVRMELHPSEVGSSANLVTRRDWKQAQWVVRAPRWLRSWHL